MYSSYCIYKLHGKGAYYDIFVLIHDKGEILKHYGFGIGKDQCTLESKGHGGAWDNIKEAEENLYEQNYADLRRGTFEGSWTVKTVIDRVNNTVFPKAWFNGGEDA